MRPKLSVLFFALACGLAFSACETISTAPPSYHRVVEASVRGEWKVSWIAEGRVTSTEDGYAFRAVQRNVYNKPDMEIHYPLGRKVTVSASNLLVEPAEKPAWLEQLDAGAGATLKQKKTERLRNTAPAGQ